MQDHTALKDARPREGAAREVERGSVTSSNAFERAATAISGLSLRAKLLAAALAGGSTGLAFAPVFAWPVMFVSFGVLVWLLDACYADHQTLRSRLQASALIGLSFGFGYFLTSLYWVAEAFLVDPVRDAWLLPFVMIGMPAGLGLFYAAAAAIAILLWGRGATRVFALAIGFGLAEFARGHVLTGLPWNLIGYSLLGNEATMQLASLFGGYALSMLAVVLFASPAAIYAPARSGLAGGRSTAGLTYVALLLLGAGYAYGAHRLAIAGLSETNVRLRIVQADIDQKNKWRPENATEIFDEYLDLTKSGGNGTSLDGISLVVWPETAVPFLLGDSPEALAAIAGILPDGTSLLAGSARIVDETDADGANEITRVYNSLLAIDHTGKVLGGYDKMHLVPFGEYLPFQDFMESIGIFQLTGIRGGFSSGQGPRLIQVPGAPRAVPLICYEIIFPDEILTPGERPGFLVNVTNDAWFGTSAGPYQHFQQARLRAVEQGLPVVRAANTGISGVIDPFGRVVAKLGLGERGTIDATLPQVLGATLFSRHERMIELAVLIIIFAAWFACRVHAARR